MAEIKERFPFIISKDLKFRLKSAKKRLGINMTALITIAIIEYLEKKGL